MNSFTRSTLVVLFLALIAHADERNVREYLNLFASRISKQPPPISRSSRLLSEAVHVWMVL
jgi:hypothetical protein